MEEIRCNYCVKKINERTQLKIEVNTVDVSDICLFEAIPTSLDTTTVLG